MAYTTTRGIVRGAARRRCDQTEGDFRTDANVDALMDTTWAEIWESILTAQPERSLKSVTFATVADQAEYAIATVITAGDLWKVKDIFVTVNGRKRRLQQFQWEEYARLQNAVGRPAYGFTFWWRIVGANIVLEPAPTSTSYTLTLWYHPAPIKWSTLSTDNTTVDTVAGWDEALIVGVAWKMALEEEDLEFADRLGAEYQRQLARILAFGNVIVTEQVEQARDVYSTVIDEDLDVF